MQLGLGEVQGGAPHEPPDTVFGGTYWFFLASMGDGNWKGWLTVVRLRRGCSLCERVRADMGLESVGLLVTEEVMTMLPPASPFFLR